MSKKIGVLIIDDSSVVRRVLSEELAKHPEIEVLGAAPDPFVARTMIERLNPDVLTLDIEMPRMDGLTFLQRVMQHHPIPAIIVSSVTPSGCDTTIACLESGAIGVVCKPGAAYTVAEVVHEIVPLVLGASRVRLTRRDPARKPAARSARPAPAAITTTNKIIALGTSTGGTEALARVLPTLPRATPGIVIVQHMPKGFTTAFAARLNTLSEIEVREAHDGDPVLPGVALLAPGDRHMKLVRDGARYIVRVFDGPRVSRHRPSVDVLFESVAAFAGANAMGVIMTGMGNDGARGLRAMRDAGAVTLAQDEASSVVWGMPGEAVKLDAAQVVRPLEAIPGAIADFAAGSLRAKAA
ncbi:MAG: chemotaxis response regulator protein-glutamate methylesterase [Phycisphaerales bacterium JB037]